MKHCNYCGKELHENASFCPYCMQNQIEKQCAVINEKKSRKRLYLMIIGLLLALLIVLVCFLMRENKELSENHSDIAIESTEATTITTTTTEPISTTITTTTQAETTISTTETTATTTQIEATSTTEMHTTTETITTTVPPETTSPQETQFQLRDYITEGKTLSQIQGYGGYEDMGGIVLTIEEITDNTLTFSIVLYDESGLASDTVSARNITADIIENTAEFEFRDMLDGRGTGRLTLENGMVHIETWGDTNRPTSIIVNEYLN